jgi:hypothetical protein
VLRLTFIATILLAAIVATRQVGAVSIGSAAASYSPAPTCANIQLLIRPSIGSGAAGHYGEMYRIHNLWSRSCTLLGFPGVALLDSHFATLPTRVIRSTDLAGHHSVRLVRLPAHGNAYFVLEWATIPTGNEPCPSAPYVMITAPNDKLPVVTYSANGGSIRPCGGRLTTSPVEPTPFSI